MRLGRKHRDYWRRNLKLTASLLAVWFVVTFVVSYFARDLADVTVLGFPLGFYMGAQGAPVIYLLIIWWYARYMNNLDREYGVAAFRLLSVLAFAGFVVHAFLPLSARLPFFAGLSLLSIPLTLGLVNGAWLVGIGFVLIAVCHLPVSFRVRGSLLLLLGAVLILQRARLLPVPWSEAIWPILGSMFMFRLIVYFYDLRHDKAPITAAQSAGYFAMLPNVCFPLFPVVDFKTWRRSHYSAMPMRPTRKASTGSSAASST
jgi:putative solute:sodium symporter small subunit